MPIPSGSGTEVIKYAKLTSLTNSWTTLKTGEADHIYTVLSIYVTNAEATTENFSLAFTDNEGTSNIVYLMQEQPLGPRDTYIINDRFGWDGTKRLRIITGDSANVNVYMTYIDQHF